MPLQPPIKFQSPKAGNRPDECEDAYMAAYPYQPGPARIALCDGASESAFARQWAQILAAAFVRRPLPSPHLDNSSLAAWLKPCEKEWRQAVPWHRIPWHGEAKTRAGAMAALLGITIDPTPNRSGGFQWQAIAVGDCCLFLIRGNAIARSFPLENSGQFNNTPSLICSNPDNNHGLWHRVSQISGECRPGDVMILTSDALACWILKQYESGSQPWQTLLPLRPGPQWETWLQSRREERAIRNDDTTLITIKID